jgi:hypothetical protein
LGDFKALAIIRIGPSSGYTEFENEPQVESKVDSKKERLIRFQHLPRDHWRWQKNIGSSNKAHDICAGRRRGCCLLRAKRQSAAYFGIEGRQGSQRSRL